MPDNQYKEQYNDNVVIAGISYKEWKVADQIKELRKSSAFTITDLIMVLLVVASIVSIVALLMMSCG